jgi:hypothetical protein
MTEGPVDIGAADQLRQFDRVGHLLQDAFGTDGGGFFEPYRRTGTQGQECLLGDSAGTDAVVTGNLVTVVGEVTVIDGGAARGGTGVPRDFGRAAIVEGADYHFVGAAVVTDPHCLSQ